MRIARIGVLAISVVVSAPKIFAQTEWRMVVGGAAIYSTQSTPSSGQLVNNPSIPEPPIGGSVAGFVASVEVPVRTTFGIGLEVSDTARFEGLQTVCHPLAAMDPACTEFDKRHRDLIISPLFHAHTRLASVVAFDAVIGPSFVTEDTLVRTATAPQIPTAPHGSGPYGPFGSESSVSRETVGMTTGVDLPLRMTDHITIGPTFRVHFISRKSLGEGNQLGLASTVLRFGGVVRIDF